MQSPSCCLCKNIRGRIFQIRIDLLWSRGIRAGVNERVTFIQLFNVQVNKSKNMRAFLLKLLLSLLKDLGPEALESLEKDFTKAFLQNQIAVFTPALDQMFVQQYESHWPYVM